LDQFNLHGADISNSDSAGTFFHQSNLSAANFKEAINYSINPMNNQITKAKFSKPEVVKLLNNFDIIIL
jgi:fluoroquinolone resistance protein